MKGLWTLVFSFVLVSGSAAQLPGDEKDLDMPSSSAPTTATARGFLYRTVNSDGKTYAYTVYVPPTYVADRAWPAILFLHGSGERGNDGFLQTDIGIARAIRRAHAMIPAIVVMPQCPAGKTWQEPMTAKMALDCLEDVSKIYRVDPNRLYLTGLSLGGRGVWYIAARTKGAFAAAVPICGGGDPNDGPKLANIPIWAWHGTDDKNVPIAETQRTVDAVEQAGGDVKFSRLAGGDHFIWDRVYSDPKLWQWLFAQERNNSAARKKNDAANTRAPADQKPRSRAADPMDE